MFICKEEDNLLLHILTKNNDFVRDLVSCRQNFAMSSTDKIEYMDVSPKQLHQLLLH